MQMKDITAKHAGGGDVIFNALTPASGDKSAAIWRPEAIGNSPSVRPRLELRAQSNGPKTARRVEMYLLVPYVRTDANGFDTVVANMPFRLEATIPSTVPTAFVSDAVAYLQSIVGSDLIGTSIRSGFAPV